MEKQFEKMIGLKYEIHGNIYEIVGIANTIVQLQSVNDDYHMEITFDDLMLESQRQTAL